MFDGLLCSSKVAVLDDSQLLLDFYSVPLLSEYREVEPTCIPLWCEGVWVCFPEDVNRTIRLSAIPIYHIGRLVVCQQVSGTQPYPAHGRLAGSDCDIFLTLFDTKNVDK